MIITPRRLLDFCSFLTSSCQLEGLLPFWSFCFLVVATFSTSKATTLLFLLDPVPISSWYCFAFRFLQLHLQQLPLCDLLVLLQHLHHDNLCKELLDPDVSVLLLGGRVEDIDAAHLHPFLVHSVAEEGFTILCRITHSLRGFLFVQWLAVAFLSPLLRWQPWLHFDYLFTSSISDHTHFSQRKKYLWLFYVFTLFNVM